MKRWYMLTVVGKDRAGIVAALTGSLFDAGANLGEASMVRLGGNFTIMLMFETEQDENAIRARLDTVVRKFNLHAHVDVIDGGLHDHASPNVRVVVHGADRPGIIAQVTAALADAGVNILDLDSDVGGTTEHPIYVMAIDGHFAGDIGALDARLGALRSSGIRIQTAPIDTLLG